MPEEDLAQTITRLETRVKALEEGGSQLQIPDDLDAKLVSYVSNPVAGTEDGVDHGLGRVPAYYVVLSLDKAGHFSRTTRPWTSSKMYLKSDVASVAVTLLVF